MAGRIALLLGLTALACPAFPPAHLAGQVSEELLERMERLLPAYRQASEEVAAIARRRQSELVQDIRSNLDTLRIGPLTVLAFRENARLASELFSRVWEEQADMSAGPKKRPS